MNGLLWAAAGTGFTFSMTTLGAAVVFFMRKEGQSEKVQKAFLGFAAGVMIAASVWSLLIPAINEAEALGRIGWIPAAGGFCARRAVSYGALTRQCLIFYLSLKGKKASAGG